MQHRRITGGAADKTVIIGLNTREYSARLASYLLPLSIQSSCALPGALQDRFLRR